MAGASDLGSGIFQSLKSITYLRGREKPGRGE